MLIRSSLSVSIVLGSIASGVYAESHDNNANCECYTVASSTTQAYFSNHRFYDFRFFAQSKSDYVTEPASITSTAIGDTSAALQASSFTTDWHIQDWRKNATTDNPIPLFNNPQNVFVMQTNNTDLGDPNTEARTYLALRTQRLQDFQSGAEIESLQRNLFYFSLRFRARVVGAAGAVAGLFGVYNDSNELDVEVLTRYNTSTYSYTNQPSVANGDEIPGASIQKTGLPSWNDWHTHRIDWLPGISRYYLDGQLVAENKLHVPTKPMFIDMNMWSDGGVWSGTMNVGDSAELHVQWIQAIFNTSGSATGSSSSKRNNLYERGEMTHLRNGLFKRASTCKTVCGIDNTTTIGVPEVTSTSQSATYGSNRNVVTGTSSTDTSSTDTSQSSSTPSSSTQPDQFGRAWAGNSAGQTNNNQGQTANTQGQTADTQGQPPDGQDERDVFWRMRGWLRMAGDLI